MWEYKKKSKVWSVILRASKVIKIAQHEKTRHKYFLHGYWYWQGLKLLIKINTKELKMACNDTISKLLKLHILFDLRSYLEILAKLKYAAHRKNIEISITATFCSINHI